MVISKPVTGFSRLLVSKLHVSRVDANGAQSPAVLTAHVYDPVGSPVFACAIGGLDAGRIGVVPEIGRVWTERLRIASYFGITEQPGPLFPTLLPGFTNFVDVAVLVLTSDCAIFVRVFDHAPVAQLETLVAEQAWRGCFSGGCSPWEIERATGLDPFPFLIIFTFRIEVIGTIRSAAVLSDSGEDLLDGRFFVLEKGVNVGTLAVPV